MFSQYVEMPIVSRPDCEEDYSGVNGVDEGMICAGIDEGGEALKLSESLNQILMI